MRHFQPNSLAYIFLLGALGALPPLSIDMALPALSLIGKSLHTTISDATLTLSFFMAGFSVAQLLFGPLSDRFGRRPILLVGCGIFTLASFACVVSPNLETLLASRFVEGCGAGAGMVMVFAIVRDQFEGGRARVRLSYISLVLSIAPMIAPTLGAWILNVGNWRTIYALLGIGGALLTAVIWFYFGETLATQDSQALQIRTLLTNYGRILRNRISIGFMLVNGLSFGCMFAYVAGSSMLMIQILGLSAGQYGLTFASTALGIIAGAFVCGKLNEYNVSPSIPLTLGLSGALVCSGVLTMLTITGSTSLNVFLPLLILATFCYGLVTPNAAHSALHPLPEIAGVAGASLGFLQMAGGAFASALVAQFSDGRTAISMTGTMSICSGIALALYFLGVRPAECRKEAAVTIAKSISNNT